MALKRTGRNTATRKSPKRRRATRSDGAESVVPASPAPGNRSAKPRARILIVDDHPLVREGLTVRISREPDLCVCGQAKDTAEAMQALETTAPDLAIVDIALQSGHGIDLTERIKKRNPHVKVLVLSMHDESLYAERALRAGALGYLNKQESPEHIIDAIRCVLAGRIYLSSTMADRLMLRATRPGDAPTRSAIEDLSNREFEVFELIGHGLKTAQIARQLHVSVKTVDSHREHIKAKLKLRTSAELSRCAVQWAVAHVS